MAYAKDRLQRARARDDRRVTRRNSARLQKFGCLFESLEDRHLLAGDLFDLGTLIGAPVDTIDSVAIANEVDPFTIDLDAAQTISAVATGSGGLAPSITVLNPGGVSIGSATGAVNGTALVQSVAAAATGTYTIEVTGAAASTGDYDLNVTINAAVDVDTNGGSNDTAPLAQDIAGSFVATAAGAERGAVVAEIDASDDFFKFRIEDGEVASLSATGEEGGYRLEVYDATGTTLLAVGSVGNTADQFVSRFRDPVDGSSADYLARVQPGSTSTGTAYSLVITRGSEFEIEDNTSLSMSQGFETDLLGGITVQDASDTTQLIDFAGMDSNSTLCGCQPPDTHGAVGPNHFVQAVNTAFTIYNKDGTVAQAAIEADEFFSPNIVAGEGFLFDPVVAYDEQLERFVVVILSAQSSSSAEADVLYAISNTSDPTDGFTEQHRFDFGTISPGLFVDYPKIGWNGDTHVISVNMFSAFSFEEVNLLAIDKSTVTDANSATVSFNIVATPNGFDDFTMAVATMHGSLPGDPMWLVEETSFGGGNSVRLLRWDNPLTTSTFTQWDVPVNSYSTPPDAPQAGGGLFTTNDARMLNAEYRDGRLVSTHAVGSGGRAMARWYEFDVSGVAPTLTQQGNVDPGGGANTYFPSIALNPQGDIGITYMQSSSSEFVSMYVTGQAFGSAPGTLSAAVLVKAGDQNYAGSRGGDYSGITVDPLTGTFWATNEISLNGPAPDPLWSTWISEFVVAPIADVDWLNFSAVAGDELTIETFTPFAGSNVVENLLDPNLELYAPDGMLVATDDNSAGGVNASISHDADQTGNYLLRVGGTADSQGTYYVEVRGTTGINEAPTVMVVTPTDGLKLTSFPTTVTLEFSESLLSSSVMPTDVSIGGRPAMSLVQVDGATFTFDVDPSAFSGDGVYAVTVEAGNVMDLQGAGNELFTSTFEVDSTGPRILTTQWNGTAFPANGMIDPGPLSFEATFDETLFTLRSARRGLRTPGADDVLVTDLITGAIYQPESFDFDAGTNTFLADFSSLPEGTYTLELISGDGAFEDLVGNDLDGDPLGSGDDATPTGDGNAGGDYSLGFVIDITTSVTVNPFERTELEGDLVRRSLGTSGILNTTTDNDQFDFFASAGESFSAVLTPATPASRMSITYDGTTHVAAAAGESVLVPIQSIPATGTISLNVAGTDATAYQLDVIKNAVAEGILEGDAVAIDGSLSPDFQGRYAAVGRATGSTGQPVFDHYSNPTLFIDISSTGTALGLTDDSEATINTTVGNAILAAGLVTVGNNGVVAEGGGIDVSTGNNLLPTTDFSAALAVLWDDIDADSGDVYWEERTVGGINTLIVQWDDRPRYSNIGSATFQVQLFETGPVAARFAYDDVDFGDSLYDFGASATVGYQTSSTAGDTFSFDTPSLSNGDVVDVVLLSPTIDVDEYTIDLSGAVGEKIDVVIDASMSLNGQTLELVDPGGNVVAVGSNTPLGVAVSNFEQGILDYAVATPGIHTVRLSFNLVTNYQLLVTSDVVFDTEPNFSSPPLRSLDDVSGALGYLAGGSVIFNQYNQSGLFVDISTTGTPLGLSDDGEASIVTTVGNPLFAAGPVTIGNNGGIVSGNGQDIDYINESLPNTDFDAALFPFWDDIDSNSGNVYWEELLVDGIPSLIVQWNERPHYSGVGEATFQLQLFAAGPVAARYVYSDVDFGDGQFDLGASATIGYQTSSTTGGQFSQDQASVADGDVIDLLFQETDSYTISLGAGESIVIRTETPLDGAGNSPLNPLNPELAIVDGDGNVLASDLDSAGGNNARLEFTAASAGTYRLKVNATSGFGEYYLRLGESGDPCDFDQDGDCDIDDMNILYDSIAAGTASNTDIGIWLDDAGVKHGRTFLAGDTNLDGDVDGMDFTILAANFGNTGLPDAYWGNGNFNGNTAGDFVVGGADFTSLAANFGFSSVAALGVTGLPVEPSIAPATIVARPGVHGGFNESRPKLAQDAGLPFVPDETESTRELPRRSQMPEDANSAQALVARSTVEELLVVDAALADWHV